MNPYEITDTHELIGIVERVKAPANYLLETIFPNVVTTTRDVLDVEYIKEGRRLAPFVVRGSRGLNVARTSSRVQMFKPSLIGAKRVIGLEDISRRQFGELPIYSSITPQERAAQLQARDLTDLLRMIQNRKAAMCAELLQTGRIEMRGYADDGRLMDLETLEYDFDGAISKDWTATTAKIYDDIRSASDEIQESSGIIPTLLICGKNIENYMKNNKEMREFLFSANANALSWINFRPQYTSPQVRHIGYIASLNLEVVSYLETYTDDEGEIKPFIDADSCILCNPGLGTQMYGAVNYLDNTGSWHSAAAAHVPVYNFSAESQTTSLTVFSRFLPVPQTLNDWKVIKVA